MTKIVNFYPGPSKIYPQINAYLQEAAQSGILGVNHRSPDFMAMTQNTLRLLKEKLNIPSDYWIFFTSSATECWEILAQSLIKQKSLHIFNGAFGEKWWEYTQKLKAAPEHIKACTFGLDELLALQHVAAHCTEDTEMICLTHNETSNATALSNEIIASIKDTFPESLIAVDATSSLGGAMLEIENADIWYASVQKCLGLPAGMAVMCCSPRAIARALAIGENQHYNSMVFMIENMEKFQTTHTPNILNIFLLGKVMEQVQPIKQVAERLALQAGYFYELFEDIASLKPLVSNPLARSQTVLAWQSSEQNIKEIKEKALKQNIILGNGYKSWKSTTFRVANFPAISAQDIVLLDDFIQKIMK